MSNPSFEIENPEVASRCFLHALWRNNRFLSRGLNQRELRMMNYMDYLTDLPDWEDLVFEESYITKWKEEVENLNFDNEGLGDVYMSDQMFEAVSSAYRGSHKRESSTNTT